MECQVYSWSDWEWGSTCGKQPWALYKTMAIVFTKFLMNAHGEDETIMHAHEDDSQEDEDGWCNRATYGSNEHSVGMI